MSTIFEPVSEPVSEPVTESITDLEPSDDVDHLPPESLEVHRDGPLSLVVGAFAGVVAVAFLLRAVGTGSLLDWALFALTGAVAVMHLAALVDARAPLLVLDTLGVRLRRGSLWEGVAWSDVDHLEHLPRASTLRDGSLTVVTTDGRRLGTRLSLSTRLVGADWHEVEDALEELSGGSVTITSPPRAERPAPKPLVEVSEDVIDGEQPESEPVLVEQQVAPEAEETPEPEDVLEVVIAPQRESRPALRGEVLLTPSREVAPEIAPEVAPEVAPGGPESAGSATPEELPASEQTQTIVIDGDLDSGPFAPRTPVEPVVGRHLALARQRVGVSVESLAERTRIRPHVIEAIEVDDFESCGGDFYARGHLRTLARVLGVDSAELLALYDEHYAHAPIDARRVFEAELAGAQGSGRVGRGGPNWSVLVASVMAVVLVWSVARLVMEGPVPLSDQPVLNGSPGGRATLSGATTKVPVTLTAATGGARVIVRDARQQVVFDAQLAFMQTAELSVAPPVRVSTTDGGLLVTVDGTDEGALGATGQDAQRTYVP
ncbi:helix-turn-helix domain-containing protein [Nocardioides sp.]|uniref:helix-turn-helix domain-containing protein n=1 Tax=Nocardioides sp. TaxID=35761 RepID=UPI002B26F9B2|nr:helix-turn-helix domain-containing protein [Nocardioides sp.]